jgi:AraC-like DNA-binding protein
MIPTPANSLTEFPIRNNLIETLALRQQGTEIAVTDLEVVINSLLIAASDYFSRPADLDELKSKILSLLNNSRHLEPWLVKKLEVRPSEIPTDSADGRFLKQTIQIVESHIDDFNFGVDVLANELAVSQTQLYRKLQGLTGSGPNEFIRNLRLLRASDLLRGRAGNVSEIAYQCGFNNLSYFAKVFKEKFGIQPSEFSKKTMVNG